MTLKRKSETLAFSIKQFPRFSFIIFFFKILEQLMREERNFTFKYMSLSHVTTVHCSFLCKRLSTCSVHTWSGKEPTSEYCQISRNIYTMQTSKLIILIGHNPRNIIFILLNIRTTNMFLVNWTEKLLSNDFFFLKQFQLLVIRKIYKLSYTLY